MSNTPFQFKQFIIQQDKAAMKVGTDGVLLGAWVNLNFNPRSILDIGAGTGLIALMMAQRCNAELIDAIELDDNSYEQTVENFENSDWGDRLFCYHASLQEFSNEIDDSYDLIISNPPFYTSTYKELSKERAMARHTGSLPYIELLKSVSKLVSRNGSCAFIIPFKEEANFIELANENSLLINRITRVRGNKNSLVKRSLLQFSFTEKIIEETELIIEIERHKYTKEYIELVKDFYLKM
ncbi:MAG: methyltransferase [Lutibacter sp.]|uniref:tRNA1(Val) (adenine(37)-N6)-methyltransferase n=1 Tax=Lutibacter sp. TaxID=1925666 RepID=UPI003859FCEF